MGTSSDNTSTDHEIHGLSTDDAEIGDGAQSDSAQTTNDCARAHMWFVDYLTGNLEKCSESDLEVHVLQCQDCESALELTGTVLKELSTGGVCSQHEDQMVDYLLDELEPSLQYDLERHVLGCPKCEHLLQLSSSLMQRLNQDGHDRELLRSTMLQIMASYHFRRLTRPK